MTSQPLLVVDDLRIDYTTPAGTMPAVHGVDFTINRGEVLAVVGESGSGKSTIAHSLVRLLPDEARVRAGSVRFDGTDLQSLSQRAMRRIRGGRIGFVPQDPSHSLNPLMRVGEQIAETLRRHLGLTQRVAANRAIDILTEVGIPDAELRSTQYPHELSGGLRQRVLIGIAWACTPDLVIADEPTSALDATVQRHVLDRIEALRVAHGTSVLLVTHDLAVAADRADRIVVVNKGRIVEAGNAQDVLASPTHEYTQRLVAAAPGLNSRRLEPTVKAEARQVREGILLSVNGLSKTYGRGGVAAAKDVSFEIPRGSTFSIVGESGSGKSTTARMIARIVPSDSGRITFDGADITALRGEKLRQLRRRIQVVYQNPFGSLDPRMKVGAIVAEPLRAFGTSSRRERAAAVRDLMGQVKLDAALIDRTPAQLSGGQRQRVAIARAIALRPEFLVLDEPVSALDVSVQEQVLQLLVDLQADFGLTYLFISHDLGVIRQVSDQIAVMRRGEFLEQDSATAIFESPRTDYTRELIGAIPGAHTAR
ncbi:peptide/nickel transport system ATP-binding protein [Microbacterium halimionae]|uniref:Peptide/nickel transport system ATP-binding protein n=1 Tax=Microbacterium halimionae TaxID=1526413 RepID=A0A7W3PMJ9_9MICO|nr:ABC transporter ATP-binding protein [Microbacterium halimionae]MBA8817151.1 peptide/nickel transport system ATP-binding protein [Microbacterium halimionae]NII94601.1 peptide/nickel transport system ATP-binding protein [Microbacterium halimionae]